MAIPVIRVDGALSGPGSPGLDRFVTAGEVVTLVDTELANAGANYQWTILDSPIGAGTVLNNPDTATPTFTAPSLAAAGTVLIRCVVNGVDEATVRAAVGLENTGARIPAFGERDEWNDGGALLGWHEAMTDWMRAVDVSVGIKGMELIEVIEPLATSTAVTFAGLNGDDDSSYHLRIRWVMPTPSAARLQIQPNGLSTNQRAVWTVTNGFSGVSSNSQDEMICAVCETEAIQYYTVDMTATTGVAPRAAHWQGGSSTGTAAADANAVSGYSIWDETATNITSLGLVVVDGAGSVILNQISTASRFELYRLRGQ